MIGYRRRGAACVIVIMFLFVLIAFASLAIDTGILRAAKADLQKSADAGALSGVIELIEEGDVFTNVDEMVNLNTSGATITTELGVWDEDTFYPGALNANAVRVSLERDETLTFARIFGNESWTVHAVAVAVAKGVQSPQIVPVGLRTLPFGPVDPNITEMTPEKDGPSFPSGNNGFELGEEITVYIFGKGPRPNVHLILELPDLNGVSETNKALQGDDVELPRISIGDRYPVFNNGTGNGNFGEKLVNRIEDDDPSNDVITGVIVDTDAFSRDDDGILSGEVIVVDFVGIKLLRVDEETVPNPSGNGTLKINLLIGEIVPVVDNDGGFSDDDGNTVHAVRLVQ